MPDGAHLRPRPPSGLRLVSRLWPSCPSPSFLCGAPLFLTEPGRWSWRSNSTHQGPSRLGWGGGHKRAPEGHGAALSRPREAACPAVSLASPCPGAGLPRTTSAVGTCSVLSLLQRAVVVGWRPVGIRGKAGTQHAFPGGLLHLCKADLEERLGLCGVGRELLGPARGPCLPQGVQGPLHLAKHKLCGVQPHCLVPGAFLTIKCAHLQVLRGLENDFSYTHLVIFPSWAPAYQPSPYCNSGYRGLRGRIAPSPESSSPAPGTIPNCAHG